MNHKSKHTTLRFSAAAPGYSEAVDIQRVAAHGVLEMLATVPPAKRIVDLGCGTGILTRLLAAQFPASEVHGVDNSEAMLQRARKETAQDARIVWHVADAASFCGAGTFDLAASSSSLHWMGPLSRLFANTMQLLSEGGQFVFSIMLDGTLGELHDLRRHLVPAKNPTARLPDAHEVLSSLGESGFHVESHRTEVVKVTYASARDMLATLHKQGVTGGAVSRGKAPLTRRDLTRLERSYDALYTLPDGGVYASFTVLFCRAVTS